MTTTLLAPPVTDDATRRQFLAGGLAAGLLLGACGRGGESNTPAPAPTSDGFPVTITHALDTTTIPARLERIAALRPDLILATNYFGVADVYAQLSRIAPTVAYETGWGEATWQESSTVIVRVNESDNFGATAGNNPTLLNIPWQLEQQRAVLSRVADMPA